MRGNISKPVIDSDFLEKELDVKTNKVVPSAEGNIAALDANGNIIDSGKVINNAVLTIKRNNETLGSFGSNAETDKIINIEVPVVSNIDPLMDGTASAGSSVNYAAADHVHPTDTSRAAANNFYVTSIDIQQSPDPTLNPYTTRYISADDFVQDGSTYDVTVNPGDGYLVVKITEVPNNDSTKRIILEPYSTSASKYLYIYNETNTDFNVVLRSSDQGQHTMVMNLLANIRTVYEFKTYVDGNVEYRVWDYASGQLKNIVLNDGNPSTGHSITFPVLNTNKIIGSAAFTNSTDYATSNHNHDDAYAKKGWTEIFSKYSNSDLPEMITLESSFKFSDYSELLFVFSDKLGEEVFDTKNVPTSIFATAAGSVNLYDVFSRPNSVTIPYIHARVAYMDDKKIKLDKTVGGWFRAVKIYGR